MPEGGVVVLRCWERMSDEHLAEFASKVRWNPPLRLVVDHEVNRPNEAYRLYEETGDERLRTVM